MPDVEAFMGLAELGLGLAGFSGIALALVTSQHAFDRADRALISFVLTNSLMAAGLAVLPVAAGMLEMSADVIWRTCSGFHAISALAAFFSPMFGRRALLPPLSFLWSMRVNLFVILVLQFSNASGWLFSPSGGVYFVAVLLILPGTAFAFGRLLFQFLRRRAG